MKNLPLRKRVFRATIGPVLDRSKRWLSSIRPYQPMMGGRQLLDQEYAEGVWDFLRSDNELPRLNCVAGYCYQFKPKGKFLEIGCGEGVLQELLCTDRYARYVGIDIASKPIERAKAKENNQIAFFQADATQFEPAETFDLILFNECLEYFADPVALLERYKAYIATDGFYIVSQFDSPDNARTRQVWQMLAPRYKTLTQCQVSTYGNYTWNIRVLIP